MDSSWKAALSGEPYDIEHQIVVEDRAKWVRERAGLEFDRQHALLAGFGTDQDITDRKQAEEALRRAHDELEIKVEGRTRELSEINEALQAEIGERNRAEEAAKAERQRLYEVLETLPTYVVLLAQDYQVPFANRFFRERFGESGGLRCFEYLFGRTEPCEVCETYTVLKTNAPITGNGPVRTAAFTTSPTSPSLTRMAPPSSRRWGSISPSASRPKSRSARYEPSRTCCSPSTTTTWTTRPGITWERMHALIIDLLRYSRITSQPESYTVFNLEEPVQEAMADLGALFEESEGRVEVGELPEVEADRVQMRQLFQNLICNALKYRGERKPVVRVYCTPPGPDSFCDVRVENNGIGFDEFHLDKIFKPFQRIHGRSSAYEGTGMGLAICRKIVDRHGGTITARSEPRARGRVSLSGCQGGSELCDSDRIDSQLGRNLPGLSQGMDTILEDDISYSSGEPSPSSRNRIPSWNGSESYGLWPASNLFPDRLPERVPTLGP